jgi:hypothetical protein
MPTHIFAQNGYDSTIIAIEAETELEARGMLQKKTSSGISPPYQGTLDELMEEGVVQLHRL